MTRRALGPLAAALLLLTLTGCCDWCFMVGHYADELAKVERQDDADD